MRSRFEAFMGLFGMREFPILFRYVDELPRGTLLPAEGTHLCLFALLAATRSEGRPVALSASHPGCRGGGYYLGFLETPREGIEHFLSCGIPGRMEGERYLKTPALARALLARCPARPAPKRYALFTRGDDPRPADDPEVVIFFAPPDAIAGLHMLAGFDRGDEAVVAPFSSGCGAVVTLPIAESARESPRAVLGLFDPSARPHAEADLLTFAVPYRMFLGMAANAPESFLGGKTWTPLKRRIAAR